MKTTRHTSRYAVIAALALAAAGAAAAEDKGSFELVVGYQGLSPQRDVDWKSASGLEIQGRFWQNEHIGIALAGASASWKARTAISEVDDGATYVYTSISGDATITSFGASLLYRTGASGDVNLVLDLGLRYAMVNSSVYSEAAYDGLGGPNYLYDKIRIENAMLFVAAADLEFRASKDVSLLFGLGYQVDLQKPEERFAGESLGDTDLGATLFRIGLACRF